MSMQVKGVHIFNTVTAVVAFALSGYTFVHDRIDESRSANEATERMLFGSYTLGMKYEQLLLCSKNDLYAHCSHRTQNIDFAKLSPLAEVVLGVQVNWPALRGSGPLEDPANASDPTSASNIVNSALDTHYVNRRVSAAFVLGRSMELLFDLADNPSTKRTSSSLDLYSSVAKNNVDDTLVQQLDGLCKERQIDNVPQEREISKLDSCISGNFLPEL